MSGCGAPRRARSIVKGGRQEPAVPAGIRLKRRRPQIWSRSDVTENSRNNGSSIVVIQSGLSLHRWTLDPQPRFGGTSFPGMR